MASQDMDEFIRYQSARAIRDAATHSGGVAGLGASISVGKQIAQTMSKDMDKSSNIKIKCKNCGCLNDEKAKFCIECGESFDNKDIDKENIQEQDTDNINTNDELYKKLREYKKLLDEGALTQEEYDAIKKRLLK